jgi:hypothetical protein
VLIAELDLHHPEAVVAPDPIHRPGDGVDTDRVGAGRRVVAQAPEAPQREANPSSDPVVDGRLECTCRRRRRPGSVESRERRIDGERIQPRDLVALIGDDFGKLLRGFPAVGDRRRLAAAAHAVVLDRDPHDPLLAPRPARIGELLPEAKRSRLDGQLHRPGGY